MFEARGFVCLITDMLFQEFMNEAKLALFSSSGVGAHQAAFLSIECGGLSSFSICGTSST